MLNGLTPIIIFSFKQSITKAIFDIATKAGIPIIGDVLPGLGIPIPIYLDEKFTGIYVESESKAMDIETKTQARYDSGKPNYEQRGLSNIISVNMLSNRDSVMLAVILAMNDMIFQRVVSKEYAISYFNGATTIFNGLLHGFSTQQGSDDDLTRIVLQISKDNLSTPRPSGTELPLQNITSPTPPAVKLR